MDGAVTRVYDASDVLSLSGARFQAAAQIQRDQRDRVRQLAAEAGRQQLDADGDGVMVAGEDEALGPTVSFALGLVPPIWERNSDGQVEVRPNPPEIPASLANASPDLERTLHNAARANYGAAQVCRTASACLGD